MFCQEYKHTQLQFDVFGWTDGTSLILQNISFKHCGEVFLWLLCSSQNIDEAAALITTLLVLWLYIGRMTGYTKQGKNVLDVVFDKIQDSNRQ
jgi:hypothetical protein